MDFLRKIIFAALFFAASARFAAAETLDLRPLLDGSRDLWQLDDLWEYSASRILPGQPLGSETGHPQYFWVETSTLGDFGSFRLFIKRNASQEPLLLKMPDVPIYRVTANGKVLTVKGSFASSESKPLPERGNRSILLPQADTIELILDVATPLPRWQSWPLKISVGAEGTIRRQDTIKNLTVALILGGLLIIGLYHIALFAFTPGRPVALIFGIFCLVNAIRTAVNDDSETLHYVFPHFSYEISYKLQLMGYYLAPALFLNFLHLVFPATVSRRLLQGVWGATVLFCLFVLSSPVATYVSYNPIFHIVTLAVMLASFRSVALACRQGLQGSITLLVSCIVLIGATINDLAYVEKWHDFGPIAPYALLVFMALQSLILSAQFSSAFAELAHTYKEFTKIVYLHTVNMISRGLTIEETLPSRTEEAVIVAFDIVGSSKIKHENFAQAVEIMMGRCYEAMSQGYDATHLACPGYRIKEMGDGLLCSIGFPFSTGSNENHSMVGLKLAERFASIFKEEMERLHLPTSSSCAIGMAKGQVEGFFPRFGNKQYDLRGKAIMLATRYEAMRNIVYNKTERWESIIFIQDAVYQELSVAEQEKFMFWDTKVKGQSIRDDVTASCAWYKFVPSADGTGKDDEVKNAS